jgi:phage terminase large subunit-like protein
VSEPGWGDAVALLNNFPIDAGPGRRAVPWESVATGQQVVDALAVLRGDEPRWHLWLRPRGMSKTTDAALVALAALLTIQPPNSRSLVYAVDADQAALLFERMAALLEPLKADDLVRVTQSRITNVRTKAFLTVESSDAPSALGHTPWLVIIDEFCAWPDTRGPRRLWSAVVSSMPKRPDSRLLVISSAGDPGNWTHEVVRQAQEGASWRLSRVPGPCPWWSPRDVAKQREALSDSAYSWYVLNEFAASENALVSAEDLDAAVDQGVTSRPYDPDQRYAIGVDLGRKVDASVVAVAHREGERVVVDHVERWLPTRLSPVRLETVEAAVARLQAEYGQAHVRMDPAKGEQMSQSLRERGLSVEEYTFSEASIDRLASGLARLFGERRIGLPDLPALRDELATVVLKTTPSGRTRIDHHSGKHDDQAVAVALAAHWLMGQTFYGQPAVTSSEAFRRAAPLRRDRRTPARGARGHVARQDAAALRLARMVRRR